MKTVLVLSIIICLSVSAPVFEDAEAKILSYQNDSDGEGNYEFGFETSNGISRKESGRLVNAGQPDEHIEVQGEYSYTDAEGKLVIVQYTADEDGYRIKEGAPLTQIPQIQPIVASLPASAVASLLG